ncbi:FkbM family methyltransferase [Streptomyces sp. NPDC020747]|uniref:FkbM family methyltransferase n=1 Tax=Streptomyces sp. NPDC020747 TaxID=3365086 RepID=UPI00378ACE8D
MTHGPEIGRQVPFVTTKYLHREADPNGMSTLAALRREVGELATDIHRARSKYGTEDALRLAGWSLAYHVGMSVHPLVSRKLKTVPITSNNTSMQVAFRRNQSDIYILREVFLEGIYDFPYSEHVPKVRTIVDLGANIGLAALSLAAQHPNARVLCVEPVDENVRMLEINRALNGFDIEVTKAAVDAVSGEVTLFPNEWWSSSTITPNVASAREGNPGRMEQPLALKPQPVKAITIDELSMAYGVDQIDVLKMDIEGAEANIMAGSLDWLDRVGVLIMEIHRRYVEADPIIAAMESKGFTRARHHGPCDVFVRT